MLKTFQFLLLSLVIITVSSCAQPPVNPLEGAWKLTGISVVEGGKTTPIETPGVGAMMFHGNSYSQVWMESDRMYSDPPTDLEKLVAYDAFDASSGTYTYENQQLTLSPQISRDPRAVGKSTSTKVVIEMDTMTRTREQPSREDPSQMMQWTSVYTRVK